MDLQCLVDMRRDEIIVPTPRARDKVRRCLGRRTLQAEHGIDIIYLFILGEETPVEAISN